MFPVFRYVCDFIYDQTWLMKCWTTRTSIPCRRSCSSSRQTLVQNMYRTKHAIYHEFAPRTFYAADSSGMTSWCFRKSLSDRDSEERQTSGPQATPTTSLVGDCDLWNGCISHHETVSQDYGLQTAIGVQLSHCAICLQRLLCATKRNEK